jgi:hypothetical protein
MNVNRATVVIVVILVVVLAILANTLMQERSLRADLDRAVDLLGNEGEDDFEKAVELLKSVFRAPRRRCWRPRRMRTDCAACMPSKSSGASVEDWTPKTVKK